MGKKLLTAKLAKTRKVRKEITGLLCVLRANLAPFAVKSFPP
jgi:hypothetical protein